MTATGRSRRPVLMAAGVLALAFLAVGVGWAGGGGRIGPSPLGTAGAGAQDDDGAESAAGRAPVDTPLVASASDLVAPTPAAGATGCRRVLHTGDSIQDAIDAVTDHRAPYVLCLDGTFVGGGAPAAADRPGIGPYFGNVVITGRTAFTLRGLEGARILGIPNPQRYPAEDAPVEAQAANDSAILVKVADSDAVVLEGLTIDGFSYPDPASTVRGHPVLNRLVWLQHVRDSAVRGNVIKNAGGECVRIKSNSQRNEVDHNDIAGCGYYQFRLQPEERLRKNGEAIYIGTDPAQIATTQVNKQRWWGLDPALVTDRSSFNRIHHNRLRPGPAGGTTGAEFGNECVDIKEDWPAARPDLPGDLARGEPGHNEVTDNDCAGQFDPESGALDTRGPGNVFTHNRVSGPVQGAALRSGGGEAKEIAGRDVKWNATGTVVRKNIFAAYEYDYALKTWKDEPPAGGAGVCGNVDGTGSASFGGRFARQKAAVNQPDCPDDAAPAGPRGAVGASP